ncbi:MAG: terpene cyclase/mutase family protein [Gemmatales bacterium]
METQFFENCLQNKNINQLEEIAMNMRSTLIALTIVMSAQAIGFAQPPRGGKTREQAIDAAIAFLKGAQSEDGSWSKAASPGVTGIVLAGLLKSGKVRSDEAPASAALKHIESMIDSGEGHLAGGPGRIFHKNYITSVNLAALKAADNAKYDPIISAATSYLKKGQAGASDGKTASDPNYGGFGYGPNTRSDLSNSHFVLDALKLANLPKDDPVYQRAVVFISRMQNLKGEFNDQPWASKINDGSFIYVLPQPGAKTDPSEPRPGYGSMTAAGVKGLLYCGVSRDDARVKKGTEWIANNYSVDINPGRQEGAGGQGYYYYLLTLAKCMEVMGDDEFTDAKGKKHDWRAEITRALINRQKPNGSWANDFGTWMETNPNLCTGYALQTLEICKPKSK